MIKIIVIVALFTISFSQKSEAFLQALSLYNTSNYEEAENGFSLLKRTSERDAAYIMTMFSQYAQGKYIAVEANFERYLERKRDDSWLGEANYIAGKASFHLEKYTLALEYWLKSLDLSADKELHKKSIRLAISTIERMDNEEELSLIRQKLEGERSLALLAFKLSEKEENSHKFANARHTLSTFINQFPESIYITRATEKIAELDEKLANSVRIGVMLPFTSIYPDEQDLAERLFEGVEYAVSEYNKTSEIMVSLVKVSTGNSILEAVKAVQELVKDQSISAIIGPHSSDHVAAIAPIVSANNITLITPTATQSGLTDISDHIFMVNSDHYSQGKFIAEYAFGTLGYRTFGVLKSAFGKSFEIAKGFTETLEQLGAEVLSEQLYYQDFREVKSQFDQIRNAGLKRMFRDSVQFSRDTLVNAQFDADTISFVSDSLLAVADTTLAYLDSAYYARTKRYYEAAELTGVEIDSSKFKVTSIDAIFLPISTNDSERIHSFISSSFVDNRFDTHLLGSSDWYVPKKFESNRTLQRNLNDIYIFTPYTNNSRDSLIQKFNVNFTTKFGKRPGVQNLLGLRAAEFMLNGISEIGNTREQFYLNLMKTDRYVLTGGDIQFIVKDRVNSGFKVLQYSDKQFKLQE